MTLMCSSKTVFELTQLAEQFSLFVGQPVFVSTGSFCVNSSPYEQERAVVQNAVALRQIEFYSGRYYAREALRAAGCMPQMILRAEKGNPLWPQNVCGSITHDQQSVIAAVVPNARIKGIGVDLIVDPASVEPHLLSLIGSDIELHYLAQAFSGLPSLALIFGVKESVVKAVSPHIDHYLDLLDIHLSLDGRELVASLPKLGMVLKCQVLQLNRGFVTIAIL